MTTATEKIVWSRVYQGMSNETYVAFSKATDEVCIYQPDLIGTLDVVLDFADLKDIYHKIKKIRKKNGH